jgi:hypothetical protein
MGMLQAAAGDAEARKRLREDILNWQAWEESILFACDRLSRGSEAGVRAVAAAVEDALGIDPILAGATRHCSASRARPSFAGNIANRRARNPVSGCRVRSPRMQPRGGRERDPMAGEVPAQAV